MLLNTAKYQIRLRLANFAIPYDEEQRIIDIQRQIRRLEGKSDSASKLQRAQLREQMKGQGKVTNRGLDATGRPSPTSRGIYPKDAIDTAIRKNKGRNFYLDLEEPFNPQYPKSTKRRDVFSTARKELAGSKDIRSAMRTLSNPNTDPKAYERAYILLNTPEAQQRLQRLANQTEYLDTMLREAGYKRQLIESGQAPNSVISQSRKLITTRKGKQINYTPAIKGENSALRRLSQQAKSFDINQYPRPQVSNSAINEPTPLPDLKKISSPAVNVQNTSNVSNASNPPETSNSRNTTKRYTASETVSNSPLNQNKVASSLKNRVRLPRLGRPATIGAGLLGAGTLGILGINAYQAAQRSKQREDELRNQLYRRYM